MANPTFRSRLRTFSCTAALACTSLISSACSSDTSDDDDGGGSGGSSGSGAAGSGGTGGTAGTTQLPEDVVDTDAIAACPPASSLLETDDWSSCLAGMRFVGVTPFGGDACELRIGDDAEFDYVVDGEVMLSIPSRDEWLSSSGSYQNDTDLFLASIAPELEPVSGEPRVERITITLFGRGLDENIEVQYMDAALSRQTENCTVDVL
jgi:hypothetical protein